MREHQRTTNHRPEETRNRVASSRPFNPHPPGAPTSPCLQLARSRLFVFTPLLITDSQLFIFSLQPQLQSVSQSSAISILSCTKFFYIFKWIFLLQFIIRLFISSHLSRCCPIKRQAPSSPLPMQFPNTAAAGRWLLKGV